MLTCYVYFGQRMCEGVVSEHIALEIKKSPNSKPLYISFCSADKKHGFLLSDPQKIVAEKQELSKNTFYIQLLDFSAMEQFFSVMQKTELEEGFAWNEPLTPFKRGFNSATVAAYFLKLGGIVSRFDWSNQDDFSFLYTSSQPGIVPSSVANKALYDSFCCLNASADDIACLFHFAQNINPYLGPRGVRDLAFLTCPLRHRLRQHLPDLGSFLSSLSFMKKEIVKETGDDAEKGEAKIAEVVVMEEGIEEVESYLSCINPDLI